MSDVEHQGAGDKFDVVPVADLVWRKSSQSKPQECVEVAIQPDMVFVRDSEQPEGAWLRFTHAQWQRFVDAVALGEFDLPSR